MKFDLQILINDLGGAAQVSQLLGKSRTTAYRYLKQGFMTTRELEILKSAKPELDINSYFKEEGKR